MGIGTLRQAIRRGLVVVLFLSLSPPGCLQGQPREGAPEAPTTVARSGERQQTESALRLKSWLEIERSGCKRRYRNPLSLLWLAPGTLFFVFALSTRKRRALFPFAVVLLLAALLGNTRQTPESLVQEAQRRFLQGDYRSSMELYRKAEELLPCNPALEYNLGVVSHHLQQRGQAIHYLRRSLGERPGDPQVRSALKRLEALYGLQSQLPAPLPVDPDLVYLLFLVLANASLVMAALVVRVKRVQFLISLVLLAIAALGSLIFFVERLSAGSRSVAVVIPEQAELLRVPEEDSRPWLGLPSGTSLEIRGETSGYYLVQTASKLKGWVHRDAVLLD